MSALISALKGALDYTRTYRDQTFVIKVGGELLDSRKSLAGIATQVALLESLSIRTILVHGGGAQASRMSRRLGIEPEIVSGRRVTSPEALEVCKMVFAGQLNVDLLLALREQDVKAVGLSGIDGHSVTAARRPPVRVRDDDGVVRDIDYGEVGNITNVETAPFDALLEKTFVPVVAPLAADESGRPLNVNADTLAVAIAVAIGAAKLLVLTSAPGVLRDPEDPSSLVAYADPDDLDQMIVEGTIRGGMRPKIDACIEAVRSGIQRTHIIDGRVADALLVELFTGAGLGTMIVGRREKRDYREHELTEV